ncbi:unnamed protein product [Ceratitis capitata]|uniref:(Mediterranean fruit fly) hypothetical protein n=1 Tax=Ceratitis capitata TaxID=7213 RepID=A0A811UL34_CERCA|nr:unnamed protein product [Ceratitis capitata]
MSLASVHGPQFTDICSPLGQRLTIEELRQHMGSCFTCGVSWTDDHVSLDCSECGGYSLERPCPYVMASVVFSGNVTSLCSLAWCLPSYQEAVTHLNPREVAATVNSSAAPSTCATAATQMRLAQELCLRLEKLSASAHT